MKILVTGGTGTISSGIVKACIEEGYETYSLNRGSKKERNIHGVNTLYADIRNLHSILECIENKSFDVVVECLAYNIEQLKISLDAFSNCCTQYVFISTAGIYTRINDKRIEENDLKDFKEWSYTKEKIDCENYLKDYSLKTGLRYTIIRPTVTYGSYRIPFPISTRTPGWTFFERMESGNLMLASDNVKYSIIHIDDFSNMVIRLFGNEEAINEDFHISSNQNDIFWDDVIIEASKILEVSPKIVHVSANVIKKIWPEIYEELTLNKNKSLILDDKKIKKVTKISAEINLNCGLRKIIASMRNEYEQYFQSIDTRWNDYCNAVIYYAYKRNLLSKTEHEIVDNYIKCYGKSTYQKSMRRVLISNLRGKLSNLKNKVNECLIKG